MATLHSSASPSPSEGSLIYVVDDQRAIGEVVAMGLDNAGYRAEVFDDPLAALATFASANPKPVLLISDYNMPGMDGLELLKRCKELSPSLKTLSFSGTLSARDLQARNIKPDAMLPKPVRLGEFLSVVGNLLAAERAD